MPIAYVHLPPQVHYRREAFIEGFAALGFSVRQCQPSTALGPEDAAVIWNKTARSLQTVEMARKGGGALLVAENGYYTPAGADHQPYAIALDGHNGSGRWYAPDDSRLKALDIPFKPFRPQEGSKVVVAAQRGIGSPEMRSPPGWHADVADRLFKWDVVVRPHPGMEPPATALLDDLEDARCLVVWSSNCATTALINGIPTYYAAPHIITAPAARKLTEDLDLDTYEHLRHEAFAKMAWAQWTLDEIRSGLAIKTLLRVQFGHLPAVQRGLGL